MEILNVSIVNAREKGEKRKVKCNFNKSKPFSNEVIKINPWQIAMNHVKHTGIIYRKANSDKELWQNTRFMR